MTNMLRAFCAFTTLLLVGCAHYVMVEPIKATVVDDENGQPLEGVHVVYHAVATEGTLSGHGGERANLLVAEGLTNSEGIIEFSEREINAEPFGMGTNYDLPRIYIFKSGYLPATEGNAWLRLTRLEDVTRWHENGKTIRLKKPQDFGEYLQAVSDFGYNIERIYRDPPARKCEWKRIPRMILYLDQENSLILERAGQMNRYAALPTVKSLQQPYLESKCGSISQFFVNYGSP